MKRCLKTLVLWFSAILILSSCTLDEITGSEDPGKLRIANQPPATEKKLGQGYQSVGDNIREGAYENYNYSYNNIIDDIVEGYSFVHKKVELYNMINEMFSSSASVNVFGANAYLEYQQEVASEIKESTTSTNLIYYVTYKATEDHITGGTLKPKAAEILYGNGFQHSGKSVRGVYETFMDTYGEKYIKKRIYGASLFLIFNFKTDAGYGYTREKLKSLAEINYKRIFEGEVNYTIAGCTEEEIKSISYNLKQVGTHGGVNISKIKDEETFRNEIDAYKEKAVQENNYSPIYDKFISYEVISSNSTININVSRIERWLKLQSKIQDKCDFWWIELQENQANYTPETLSQVEALYEEGSQHDVTITEFLEDINISTGIIPNPYTEYAAYLGKTVQPTTQEPYTIYSDGSTSSKTRFYFADVNGDGKDDKIYWNRSVDNGDMRIYLANGNDYSVFESNAKYSQGSSSSKTIFYFADVNGDGKDDKVYWNRGVDGGKIRVYLAKGDGTFKNYIHSDGSTSSKTRFYFADVNGDGKDDKIYWNRGVDGGKIRVYLAKGDGTFKNYIYSDGSTSSKTRFYFADINGDGCDDKIYWNRGVHNGKVRVYLAKGNGTFKNYIHSYGSTSSNTRFYFADVNGDGKDDKIYWNRGVDSGKIRVYLSKGNGSFENYIHSDGSKSSKTKFYFADVNGDGKCEKIYWNRKNYNGSLEIFFYFLQ
ncbi:MAG: hypothetical protein CR982_02310 [Candidatus Cloacimonadota bacterium]|nr:MAG: hypothetical protein CR982_02310 [Candidatus Cloacimonadota bacterium]PIE81095.1 MAG: hypothetical protein CSA15_01080 [Candidatus Delongbacteria bacterium]